MSDLQCNRVFRFLVCLILVLSLLVNLSPLKAESTAIVAGALTFEGLMAALFSMSIGIVAVDLTVQTWNKIGEDLGEEIANADPSVVEAWVDVEALYNSYGPDDDDPEDALEWAEKLKHALSRGLLGAIAGWLCTLVNMGGYEVKETITNGCWSYNGKLFGPLADYDPDTFWYMILEISAGSYNLVRCNLSNQSFYTNVGESTLRCNGGQFGYAYAYLNSNSSLSVGGSRSNRSFTSIVWSSHDLFDSSGSQVFAGSAPSNYQTEIMEPSIYVGDIPDQIQNGDKDENNLDLPIIDPFRVIQSPGTALDDVNQLQQQLMNGTTTLDEYLQQVQLQEPSVDPDPSSPTTPSTGTDTEWEPPQDPGKFALDLTDVFPFCIPFDLYDFLTCLNADPVTPVIQWEIAMPGGGSYPLTIDLSPFDSVAQLLRRLELLAFCIGLAIKTRDLIKG